MRPPALRRCRRCRRLAVPALALAALAACEGVQVSFKGSEPDTTVAGYLPGEAQWAPVGTWGGGEVNKDTESFRVRGPWRIVFGGDSLGSSPRQDIRVMTDSGRSVTDVRREGRGTDTSYVHAGPGTYYLEITGTDSRWTVTVEEQRPPAERSAP
jgi:hypothetical protein